MCFWFNDDEGGHHDGGIKMVNQMKIKLNGDKQGTNQGANNGSKEKLMI